MAQVMDRVTQLGPSRVRALVLAGALAVVAAVAGVLVVLGVDTVEIVATLLVVPVFGVALHAGQVAGLGTAAVATGVYVVLRRPDLGATGAASFGLLVVTRAVAYGIVVYAGGWVRQAVGVTDERTGRDAPLILPYGQDPGLRSEPVTAREPVFVFDEVGVAEPEPVPVGASVGAGAVARGGWDGGAGDAGWSTGGPASPGDGPDDGWGRWHDDAPAAWYDRAPDGRRAPAPSGDGWEAAPRFYAHSGESPAVPGRAWDAGPSEDRWEAAPRFYAHSGESPAVPAGTWDGDGRGFPVDPGGAATSGPWAPVESARSWDDGAPPDRSWSRDVPAQAPPYVGPPPASRPSAPSPLPEVDPETRLWSARYLCDRLASEQRESAGDGQPFSLVLVQVPDGPLAALSYRRQVTLLRELGHQFVAGGIVDHLVHVPDQTQHWFAAVLPATDKVGAEAFERRLRGGIGGYLRSRGLLLGDLDSACLTSPDDDAAVGAIWEALIERGDPGAAPEMAFDY